MLIRVTTQGSMDFTNYRYVIVFNTSGNGTEPYANVYQTSFQNYSFAFVVGGSGGLTAPALIQYYLLPGTSSSLGTRQLVIPNQALQFTPNSNGLGTQFTLQFQRTLFNVPNPASPSPSPGTATTAPTATPCVAASGASPCPATPSAGPSLLPTTPAQNVWYINVITTDPNGVPIDAYGNSGKNDVSFVLPVDTTQNLDLVTQLQQNVTGRVNPPSNEIGAALAGGEIINSP
jgi:hypothetical protein